MSDSTRCPECGLIHNCLCHDLPIIDSQIMLSLLMHERERTRQTNTGQWVSKLLPKCHHYLWQRQTADAALAARMASPNLMNFVVFPAETDCIPAQEAIAVAARKQVTPHFIILDATWQEARKMNRRSHWLAGIPRVQLMPSSPSIYQLRRNQVQEALCTLEISCELLSYSGETNQAQQLRSFFKRWMRYYQADKNGHVLTN